RKIAKPERIGEAKQKIIIMPCIVKIRSYASRSQQRIVPLCQGRNGVSPRAEFRSRTAAWVHTDVANQRGDPMRRAVVTAVLCFLSISCLAQAAQQSSEPDYTRLAAEGDLIVQNFTFHSGEALPTLRLHYTTWGKPKR